MKFKKRKSAIATSSRLHNILTQFPYIPQAFSLIWRAARNWTIAWTMMLVLQGLLPVAIVYLTRTLVNSLVADLEADSHWQQGSLTLVWVALMAAFLLLQTILRSLTNWVRTAQAEQVQDYLSDLIHQQATILDMAHYDNPTYYDRLHQACVDARGKPIALLESSGTLLQNGLTFVAMGGVLLGFAWWLPLVLIISVGPTLVVVLRYAQRENAWRLRNTAAQRRSHYYNWLLTERDAVAEIRLFALDRYFRHAFQVIRTRLRQERLALVQGQAMAELGAGGVALLSFGGVMVWLVWQVGQGQVTLGDLAMLYQALNQGQQVLHSLLSNVRQIYSNLLFLENLFEFLALRPALRDPERPIPIPSPLQKGICFKKVTFCYPDSERVALDNFSLTIPAGQVVALVGENGAGKSTLIKLLCRFYDPTSGSITLDDIDLRAVAQADLHQHLTVLFQDPLHYQATASENIHYGQVERDISSEMIAQAAQAAGADGPIDRLPEGYETMLGKLFGGTELSGGEWQRVALARAFIRQADIIILDEPTSAMDSWAEADWLARFLTLVTGRTALMITHRFTTAMHADMIHVMAKGRVIESGRHEELLSINGRYAESWRRQMARPIDKFEGS